MKDAGAFSCICSLACQERLARYSTAVKDDVLDKLVKNEAQVVKSSSGQNKSSLPDHELRAAPTPM